MNYSEHAYAKFKNDGEDKETLPLRSFYRAISNSFSDVRESRKDRKAEGVDVCPIINQNPYCSDPDRHKADKHKGMQTLEELIAGVFGANVGGIKRDENAKISLEVWKELCDRLPKVCKMYWDDEDRIKLTQRVAEMCLKVGRNDDMSWCKRLRCFCHFDMVKVEPKPGHSGGDQVVDGKFFFVKLESNSEEGELCWPGKPDPDDGFSPGKWINMKYGKEELESTEELQIDVLEWKTGRWSHTITKVKPENAFDF